MFFRKKKRIQELEAKVVALEAVLHECSEVMSMFRNFYNDVEVILEDARWFDTADHICLGLVDKKAEKGSDRGKALKRIIGTFRIKEVEYDEH